MTANENFGRRESDHLRDLTQQILAEGVGTVNTEQFATDSEKLAYSRQYATAMQHILSLTAYVSRFESLERERSIEARAAAAEQRSYTDEKTGLPNSHALRFAYESMPRTGSLLFIDLDHFRATNETLGHFKADTLLGMIGERLLNAVRRDEDTIGRHGGDEFVGLLPHTPVETAMIVAQRISDSIAAITDVEGIPISQTASIGVAAHNGELDYKTALEQADSAMYIAKAQGRNQVVLLPQQQ